jgi:hypothetical protein
MRGFGGFLTFLIIFKLYNGGLERWAKNPHVSNAETVSVYCMKKNLAFIFALLTINSFSQRKVTGIIIAEENGLYGAQIQEIGTENETLSNQEGNFILTTISDTCVLNISFVGLDAKLIKITSDTSLKVILEPYHYEYRWITIGGNYETFNSTFGLTLSNGLDENPLIHFEEFSENWMFKISGSTNFEKDYSFETKIAYEYIPLIGIQPSIEYIHSDFDSMNFKFSDLNLSIGIWLKRIQTNLKIQFGYQNLNELNNFGAEIGLEKRIFKTYGGFMVGYRFDYFTYKAYLQSFIYKNSISLRANYERLDNYDFLTLGLNYTFER